MTNQEDGLLQEFLQLTILCETRIGTDIAAREAQAKRDYDSALYELDVWKDERQKKDDFLAACKGQNIKPDGAAAKRLKNSDPAQYEYDPKVLAKSEIVLQALVSTMREKYSTFHHLAVSREDLKHVERQTSDNEGVDPPDDKKVYLDIRRVEPLAMNRWDDPRWAEAIEDVPLALREKETKQGEHPGESRLAVILGAMKQGDNVSFDLKTPGGWKWEVKGLALKSDKIRPGTLGIKAFREPHKQLMKVCTSMRKFVRLVTERQPDRVFLETRDREQFDIVKKFIDEDYEDIERGEIPNGRIVAWRRAVHASAWLREKLKVELGWNERGTKKLSIAGQDIDIPHEKYIVLLNRLKKLHPSASLVDIMNSVDVKEIFVTTLLHPAFDDADAWLNEWDESIDVKKIFADVSGVILVYPEGFVKVPRKLLDVKFRFFKVSKGVPYYAVV